MMNKPTLPVHFWIRLAIEVLLGSLLNILVWELLLLNAPYSPSGFFFMIGMFVFVSEGIFICDWLLNTKLPWHTHTRQRVIGLVLFTIIWVIVAKKLSNLLLPFIKDDRVPIDPGQYNLAIMVGILVIIIYVVGLVAYNYHKTLSAFTAENQHLKQEQLELNYRSLQDKLNPHFLFNNLSTLIAIIRQDKNTAITFTENLSDVYRYVLLKKDDTLVPVQEEITFIETYIALHHERLGDALNFTAEDIPPHYFIPPLSLQLLIENAIKHNVASSQSPLHLKIYSAGDYLCVENNLQLKQSSYSTQTGLGNLIKRYRFLTDKQVKVIEDDDRFIVKIPLLQKESLFRP